MPWPCSGRPWLLFVFLISAACTWVLGVVCCSSESMSPGSGAINHSFLICLNDTEVWRSKWPHLLYDHNNCVTTPSVWEPCGAATSTFAYKSGGHKFHGSEVFLKLTSQVNCLKWIPGNILGGKGSRRIMTISPIECQGCILHTIIVLAPYIQYTCVFSLTESSALIKQYNHTEQNTEGHLYLIRTVEKGSFSPSG